MKHVSSYGWHRFNNNTAQIIVLTITICTMILILIWVYSILSLYMIVFFIIVISIVTFGYIILLEYESVFHDAYQKEFNIIQNRYEHTTDNNNMIISKLINKFDNIQISSFSFPLKYILYGHKIYSINDNNKSFLIFDELDPKTRMRITLSRRAIQYIPTIDSFLSSLEN